MENPAEIKKRRTAPIVMLSVIAVVVAAVAIWSASGVFSKKSEYTVGTDIGEDEISEFYYTYSTSTNPPEYQRYRFYTEDGKRLFYHEKREGDCWPLTEDNITVSGTVGLTAEEWDEFFDSVEGGRVTARGDDSSTGGSGPYLYLYWSDDGFEYQQFSFASNEKQAAFEALCIAFKNTDTN